MYLGKYFPQKIHEQSDTFFPPHLHLPRRQSAAGRGLGTMLPRRNLLYEDDIVGPCESVLELLRHHSPAQRTY
jgi:hypothetical protein